MGLAAEPMDGQPGPIAVKLDDEQRLKVRQRFEGGKRRLSKWKKINTEMKISCTTALCRLRKSSQNRRVQRSLESGGRDDLDLLPALL